MHLAIKIYVNFNVHFNFNVHNVDYGYECCFGFCFFKIYTEATYRRGSIVSSPCQPFSRGMAEESHNEKGFEGTTGPYFTDYIGGELKDWL